MKIDLNDGLKSAIDYIISNENYETPPEIDVKDGSLAGDGYSSKTYAISIKGKNGKTVDIFAKCVPENVAAEWENEVKPVFQREFKFYQEIYPVFLEFQEKRNIKEPFDNVPRHYKTKITNWRCPPIILENLQCSGYTLRDRKKPIDHEHLKLAIRAFARYHAISYALKDQEPEVYQKLCTNDEDLLSQNFKKYKLDDIVIKGICQLLDSLDPVSDKETLDHCKNLSDILIQHTVNIPENRDEYSAITQGDCWSSNTMYLYDNQSGLPTEVKIIDWQFVRVNSPVLDFSFFFYTLATKEFLDKADYYLNFYYDTLSQRIKELGSDPEKTYPYEKFIEHWRKFALFGLTMAFISIKVQLFDKDEVPDLTSSTGPSSDPFSIILKDQDKYIRRVKDIVEYFIDKKLL